MAKYFEPGDIDIKSIRLMNPNLNAEVDPTEQLIGFDIYEDIMKPTMFAMFHFQDGINMIDKFPITGEETIEVEFITPGFSDSARFSFRVYEVSNLQKKDNDKMQTYTLRCVSEEHLYNAASIKRSIEGTMSDVVVNILRKEMQSKKPIIVDPAKGLQTVTIPTLNPLAAVDMCRQRAVSKDFASSLYVFFENQAGFNFKTIEGLIQDGKKNIGSRVFNSDQNTITDEYADRLSYRTLINYTNIKKADTTKILQSGALNTVVKTFDLASKKLVSQEFNMQGMMAQLVKADNNTMPPVSLEFMKKFGGNDTVLVPQSSLNQQTFIDTMLATRNLLAVLIDQNVTRIHIHGDSGIKVGDVIEMSLPEVTGLTGRKEKTKFSSGNYMVTRLRHIVDLGTKSKHQVTCDVTKIGMTA